MVAFLDTFSVSSFLMTVYNRLKMTIMEKCRTSTKKVSQVKVRPHLHANTNEAGRSEAYANICLDCNTRQNVVVRRSTSKSVCLRMKFSLKYRLRRQFSSPRLHIYIPMHASPRPALQTFLFYVDEALLTFTTHGPIFGEHSKKHASWMKCLLHLSESGLTLAQWS